MEGLVTIELFGQDYTFKTESDAGEAQKVADFLADEVAKVESKQTTKSLNMSKLAILIGAALNISNEHFGLKKNYTELMETVSRRSEKLIRTLDSIVE